MDKTSPSDPTMSTVKEETFYMTDEYLCNMPQFEIDQFDRRLTSGAIVKLDRRFDSHTTLFGSTVYADESIAEFYDNLEPKTVREYHAQTGTRVLEKSTTGFSIL